MNERIEALLQQMTLQEKVSLLAGASAWYTVPIERLGIPAIKVTDGPNGARGEGTVGGGLRVTSACFPVGIALAATWNTALVERVGQALGEETRSKGAHILLAPTVNIHRSPLAGRNFECYSEDPYLTARMAVAYIKGVQSQNVGATVKHFVCNDSEFQRNTISSEVTDRPLREIYLPPFRAAVQEAGTWAVMSSYNRVNGTYASDSPHLLIDILKHEWGFDGIVMSDWAGTYSTVEAANAGLDLEMPGPARWRGERLLKAVEEGAVSEERIDDSVRRMLYTIIRSGAMDHPGPRPEQAIDRPEHRALIREAGAEGIVLLKNDRRILPLHGQIKSLAIIGPNAKTARIMGGGSAQVDTHYAITPFDGVAAKVGPSVQIHYELGCTNEKMLPVLDPACLTPESGEAGSGLSIAFFDNVAFDGEPVRSVIKSTQQIWYSENPIKAAHLGVRLSGTFTAPETGRYGFSLTHTGRCRLLIDDRIVIDYWDKLSLDSILYGAGANRVMAEVDMRAGQAYAIRLEYAQENVRDGYGFRLGYRPAGENPSLERAAELAAQADVALVFVGLSGDWDSEGADRPHMDLVGDQAALIEKVAAANKNTIVVLNTGSPVPMDWLDQVAAVVQAWYPGQEAGNAIADVLFGDVNPSGKLPETFPKRIEDNPAYINYPGENGKVHYGEGLFVGYRYYDKKKIEPLFPFGFGLSYTTFTYSNLRLSAAEIAPDDALTVSVDITNTGDCAGQEVVQVYVRDVISALMRPEKELKGFAKVALDPGETKTVSLTLNRESLAYYDDKVQQWMAEGGEFEVLVGSSAAHIHAAASFRLTASSHFDGPGTSSTRLSISDPLERLLVHDGARAVLETYLPGLTESPHLEHAKQFPLSQLAVFVPDLLTEDLLQQIEKALARL